MHRYDLIFSYWLFLWFILYEVNITSYNPKIALILGLIANTCIILIMIYFNNYFIYIFVFSLVVFVLKVIPLWILRDTNLELKDVFAVIIVFIVYIIWVVLFNLTYYTKFVHETYKKIKHNKPTIPFAGYILKLICK